MTSMRRNDVASTSFRRHVPTRFLINQCQIITILILKSDIIENSRIELREIVLPVPSNQIKDTFIIILPFNLVHLWFFPVSHRNWRKRRVDYWGGQRVCWPPLPNYWGGPGPPLAPPLPTPMQRIPTLRVIYFRSTKTRNFQLFSQVLKKVKFWSSGHPAQVYGLVFVKMAFLVKKELFFSEQKSLKISTNIKMSILVSQNECLIRWPDWNDHSEIMFMMFNRLPVKKPQFQKIRKLQNLFHFNEQGISFIESLVV